MRTLTLPTTIKSTKAVLRAAVNDRIRISSLPKITPPAWIQNMQSLSGRDYEPVSCTTYFAYLHPIRSRQLGSVELQNSLICNFYVNPQYRDVGVGRALLSHLVDTFDGQELELYAKATDGMPQNRLLAFYQSFGFRQTGRVTSDGVHMVKYQAQPMTVEARVRALLN